MLRNIIVVSTTTAGVSHIGRRRDVEDERTDGAAGRVGAADRPNARRRVEVGRAAAGVVRRHGRRRQRRGAVGRPVAGAAGAAPGRAGGGGGVGAGGRPASVGTGGISGILRPPEGERAELVDQRRRCRVDGPAAAAALDTMVG